MKIFMYLRSFVCARGEIEVEIGYRLSEGGRKDGERFELPVENGYPLISAKVGML